MFFPLGPVLLVLIIIIIIINSMTDDFPTFGDNLFGIDQASTIYSS